MTTRATSTTTSTTPRTISGTSVVLLAASLALMKKSSIAVTACSSTRSVQDPCYENQQHSSSVRVLDLIVPSLQALVRALRLIQTTGLIVCDYEWYKWHQKVTQWIKQYTTTNSGTTSAGITSEELSHMTTSQRREYWEHEVQRRQELFEQAQIAYTTRTEEKNKIPDGTTYEQLKQDQKQAMKDAAAAWVRAEDELEQIGGSSLLGTVHRTAAQRLVRLCRTNAGVYIKIGQHLANLDYLIPQEYIDTLSCLFGDAPTSSFETVCRVICQDLNIRHPDDVFDGLDPVPLASASLAQVHVAYDPVSGRKWAIKVQHEGLRETCRGDLLALTTVVKLLELAFPKEFQFGWIADEIAPQLPLELDFTKEGRNADKARSLYQSRRQLSNKSRHVDVVIPRVIWNHTTPRVLCMEFEEGFRATNVEAMRRANLQPRHVAHLIAQTFHSQTFLDAWVHCDPHPANVLVRESPTKPGRPQMVLVDHGLYKQLDPEFRITYAQLWKALLLADIPTIQTRCRALGVDGKLYTLLAGLLTARPFDEVVERSKTGRLVDSSSQSSSTRQRSQSARRQNNNNKGSSSSQQDKAVIRGYAQKFLLDILTMIDRLPRQMVLLLKMNDCLRHIDYALGSSPTHNLVVAGRLAAQAVYEDQIRRCYYHKNNNRNYDDAPTTGRQRITGLSIVHRSWQHFQAWLDYMRVLWRIQIFDWGTWWLETTAN